ncbi:MAG: hypothetical protein AAGG80_06825 [Pseudomonadota bacterium]
MPYPVTQKTIAKISAIQSSSINLIKLDKNTLSFLFNLYLLSVVDAQTTPSSEQTDHDDGFLQGIFGISLALFFLVLTIVLHQKQKQMQRDLDKKAAIAQREAKRKERKEKKKERKKEQINLSSAKTTCSGEGSSHEEKNSSEKKDSIPIKEPVNPPL